MTSAYAIAEMLAWAEGRKSHNMILRAEADTEQRAQTLVLIEQADTAEVTKWGEVARTLIAKERQARHLVFRGTVGQRPLHLVQDHD